MRPPAIRNRPRAPWPSPSSSRPLALHSEVLLSRRPRSINGLACAAAACRFGCRIALRPLSAKIAEANSSPLPPPCCCWPHSVHLLSRCPHGITLLAKTEMKRNAARANSHHPGNTDCTATGGRGQHREVRNGILIEVCYGEGRPCREQEGAVSVTPSSWRASRSASTPPWRTTAHRSR
jgi:hypothetical protein